MRKWTKIILNKSNKISKEKKVKNFEDFCKEDDAKHDFGDGSYKTNKYYKNKETFFQFYLKERYKILDEYLERNLNSKEKILSISSGRAINELKFIEKKHNIVCSDLDIPECYDSSKRIVGDFRYLKFDILKDKLNQKYDCIISLSAMYLFSNVELEKVLKNLKQTLNDRGKLILEFSGPEDNYTAFFFHEIYLYFESLFAYFFSKIFRLQLGLEFDKSFTHLNKNYEIINIAEKIGFKFESYEEHDNLTELKRSILIKKIFKYFPKSKKFFNIIGKKLPYIRLFKFTKI